MTVLAMAAVFVSCQKSENASNANLDPSRPVTFSVSNILDVETKADPIANGKFVGIYAGDPINKDNVKMTVAMEAEATSGTLSPTVTNSLLWGVGQTTQTTNFLAVYPWEETRPLVGETEATKYIEYSIASSSDVQYANQFLAAAASQAPGTGETPAKVALAFKHPFAKLVYNITNTSDDYVSGVKISGVHRNGHLMFADGTVTATGDAVAANAAFALEANGDNSYMTVVMPETSAVNPLVVVEMVSGAKYSFTLSTGVAFEAGKVYSAAISITGSHGTETSNLTVLGTFTVTDWVAVDSGNMTAGSTTPATKWWYLAGNIDEVTGTTDSKWQKHIPFKCTGIYSWEVSFYYAGTTDISNGFKIRYAVNTADWSDAWGKDLVIDAANVTVENGDNPYLVTGTSNSNAPNIRINTTGKYKIVFYSDTHNFYIYKIN